ncbi:hypothetical protein ACFE04_025044 [Oxalis oulophora]
MPPSSHSSAATEVSAGRLEEAERKIAKDGFLLHLGGKLKFNDEEKTAEYVGGGRHFFPARPDEMSMNYLKTYIVMPLIEEAMIKMRSEDPRNKGKAVADDESAEQAESEAGFEGDDENDGGSDEDDLDGVSFCSECEDEEFKELIQNTKNFIESESYYEPVLDQIRDKVAADKGATEDAVPCTPRQNEPSPKKTRLFIDSTEVQFNTKIRSPRKPRKEAPNAVLEIGQPHNGQPEDVIGKKMWLEWQYSRLMDDEEIIPTRKITEIHPQFRIGSKLVKKRKPTT